MKPTMTWFIPVGLQFNYPNFGLVKVWFASLIQIERRAFLASNSEHFEATPSAKIILTT